MFVSSCHVYIYVLLECNWSFLVHIAIPEFNGSLSAVSAMNSITVSWTQPEFEPTSYMLHSVCWLQCSGAPLNPTVPTPSTPNTSAIISGLAPGSECYVTLTAIYNSTSKTSLNLLTATLSDGTFP